ncbi:MAG: DUF4352 domain-containing protein [Lachnospiraceae bacterium]|jgi:hypothetical protein|nr:DUF4352 domain-containing protein [Lachnospiraceae bacterium]
MLKRFLPLVLLFPACLMLTGCTEVIDLNENETRLIAEYAGEMLLKYNPNYNDKLSEGDKVELEMEEEALENEMNEPQTSEVTSEEVQETTEATTEADTQEDNFVDNNIDGIDDATDSQSQDEEVSSISDIAQILGIEGVSITYKDYVVTDHYPATDEEGQFLSLDAAEGYQLLVLRFNVSNGTQENVNVSLLDKDADYRIVCNGKNAAKPMLTILLNDLGTMKTTLSNGETQEGVLVFQISEDMKSKLQSMDLKVKYNNQENVITIL